jgi:hypothetical protein
METPHLTELVRRMRLEDPNVDIRVGRNGTASIVWSDPRVDDPLTLLVTEDALEAAVTALGEDSRDALWPGSTIGAAGFNLLLVHLDEVVGTRNVSAPLRVTRQGLEWPE